MSELKTPGVYVEEVTKFPPSVAQVETAIPAFIGYTEKGSVTPKRITSLLEYETHFGKANKESIVLKDTENNGLTLVTPTVTFLMYYSLQMYFANGGGPCYIISVGDYSSGVGISNLEQGLNKAGVLDEPTLIVFPDATALEEEKFYTIYQEALSQAENLKNRFVILDTYQGNSVNTTLVGGQHINTIAYFRKKIDSSTYGAAYFPHLKTVLNYSFDETTTISHTGLQVAGSANPFFAGEINALTNLQDLADIEIAKGSGASPELLGDLLAQAIAIVEEVNETADVKIVLTEAYAVLGAINDGTIDNFEIPLDAEAQSFSDEFGALILDLQDAEDKKGDADGKKLKDLKATNSSLYNQIQKEIASLQVVLPPSSTMAGVYAKTDSTKGVWKAPANVGLNYVVAPTEKVSNDEQEGLNVDAEAGKSINAIRNFTGKGTLVWGARTLDSISDEWRYVPVRRFFNMVEESVKRATEKFLFEPNDASTWLRAKAMIENYLNQQWMNGALAGSTPEDAYYVVVGGETTSSVDVLEGRMNIEIGMAVVRSAEFIVLNFSHKLQQS